MGTKIKQMIPAQPGWLAVHVEVTVDGEHLIRKEPVIAFAVVEEEGLGEQVQGVSTDCHNVISFADHFVLCEQAPSFVCYIKPGQEHAPVEQHALSLFGPQVERVQQHEKPGGDSSRQDPFEKKLVAWLGKKPTVTNKQILAAVVDPNPNQWNRSHRTRIGQIMKRLGWERRRRRNSEGAFVTSYMSPVSSAASDGVTS